jgi:hypothetical protein
LAFITGDSRGVGSDDREHGGMGTGGLPGACRRFTHTNRVCKLVSEANEDVRPMSFEKGASRQIFRLYVPSDKLRQLMIG